jgi:hypothetical protein
MQISEARDIVAQLSTQQRESLASAHARYMHAAGVQSGDVAEEQVALDRITFAHLLQWNGATPRLSDANSAAFISAATGLPAQWCIAWAEEAFCDEHGDDFFARQVARQRSVVVEHRNPVE